MQLRQILKVVAVGGGLAACSNSSPEGVVAPENVSIKSSTGQMVYDGRAFCHAEALSRTLITLSFHCASAMNVSFDEITFVSAYNGETITSTLYGQEMGPGSLWIKNHEPNVSDMEKYPQFYQIATDKFFMRLADPLPEDFPFGKLAALDELTWTDYTDTSFQYTNVVMTKPVLENGATFKTIECRAFRYGSSTELIFSDCPAYHGNSGTGIRSAEDLTKIIALATGALGGYANKLFEQKDFQLAADMKVLMDEIGRVPEHNASLNSMKQFCEDNITPCNIMQ